MVEISEKEYTKYLKYIEIKKKNDENLKKYLQTPKGRYYLLKSNAKRGNKKIEMTSEEFINWFEYQLKVCYYCGVSLLEGNGNRKSNNLLTIDRTDNSQGYSIKNIVLCCMRCNRTKSNDLNINDMIKIGKTIGEILRNKDVLV